MSTPVNAAFERTDDWVAVLKLDVSHMPAIEAAVGSSARLPPIPDFLAPRYFATQSIERQDHNRLSIIIMTIIFDLFLFVQIKTAPEIFVLSAILRLCVMTPAVLGFIILDIQNRLKKFYGPFITVLAVAPTLISEPLILLTNANNANALSDIRATPLILMATALVLRLTPRQVIINATVSIASFIPCVLFAPCIPHVQDGALILSEVSVGAAALMLTLQLESRDRRVFLLQVSAAISRAALAARNRFLLEETHTDGLTGVANRRYFDEAVASAWQEARGAAAAVGLIIMDIDHFKRFNDFYGHQGGDDCLRLVARRASQEVRRGDLFARYGGEEFAVVLPATDLETTVATAERIRTAVLRLHLPHYGVSETSIVTISLGAALMMPSDVDDVRQLIELADFNLYAAKRAGRNRVGACLQLSAQPSPPSALDLGQGGNRV